MCVSDHHVVHTKLTVSHVNYISISLEEKGVCDGWLMDKTKMKGPLLPFIRSPAIVPYSPTPTKSQRVQELLLSSIQFRLWG